ncbi:P-loop containing nucleoside triphosphate hydrolase protein [Penicillium angulare]|uniref:P-loop containing nucleoside triphosphate hydrolase protein n=1 Tax=Penicillium angulare TaxID=116970 RepID=UPI0025403190|nr:P-loop containing nucleoside triphosphate hydrolase protein [Penicillium angulare]KAJ5261249.1 P-loop containing nucleoside triphosphate hydrolase protein [Penicillium angulare]
MTSVYFGPTNSGNQVGINQGTIHLPPERPETPPPPLSTVPFRRDPDFIDCGSLLDQIQEKGSTQGARVALVGFGGVGKSQLAIEYCHRVRDRSPDTWVLWIHASNATRFEQSCREIADRAKIPGRQDPKANIFKLLHNWLHNTKTGKWIIVLDNLDDDHFLHAIPSTQSTLEQDHSLPSERSIWSYLCQSSIGCVVITSRSRGVALKTVEDYDIIPVEPMDEGHAISLFEKKLGAQPNRSAITQLVTALEFIPLAIVQAAAFIKQKAPRETVTQYLERFQKSDRQKINLLKYEGGQLRRDPEAKNCILLT